MTTRTRVPALGAEGWFTPDADEPTLLGRRCAACGTYAFPQAELGCPNPACTGDELDEVALSRRGTVWGYTDAPPPPPAPGPPPPAGGGGRSRSRSASPPSTWRRRA